MKTRIFTIFTLASLLLVGSINTFAQEEVVTEEKESPFSVGADVVSNYVWRGTSFSGPAFQPTVEFGIGGFALGAWGSYSFTGAFNEADLYAGYGFNFGLYLGVTDYYYPGSDYFEYSDTANSHAFEINAAYEIGGFSLSANYILNNSATGAGSIGNDMYFELGYAFKHVDIFVGAGNGWHTAAGTGTTEDPWTDDGFGLVNIGLGTSKEIKITDSYSLPVFGQVIINPEAEAFHIVAGFSF